MRPAARVWAIAAVAWLAPAAANAQMIATDLPAAGDPGPAATLTLAWPQPAAVAVESPHGELVLRFDQAVEYEAFAALAPRIAALRLDSTATTDDAWRARVEAESAEVDNLLRARIALRLYGREAAQRILLLHDRVAQEALRHWPEATDLAQAR